MGDMDFLSGLLDSRPSLFLDEIQDSLSEVHEIDVSVATISHALAHLGTTKKLVSKEALERNELLRAMWQAEVGLYPPEYFIWLNESSSDDITMHRTGGWASMGCACVQRATFLRGKWYSILPALSLEGIIAMDLFEGSVTKEKFISFLQNHLVRSIQLLLLVMIQY
jgi:hypothetical protein